LLTPAEKKWVAEYVRKNNLAIVNNQSPRVNVRTGMYPRYIKRVLDIVISFCACIVTLPINLILGICTYFDVGSPVFFFQKRPGRNGDLFTIVKFRNMRNAYDANGIPLPISQRVTKFGSFVRKTSLDELLNFWSILKGDMSVIGPRPLADIYLDRYSERHKMRHAVRPGLECPNIRTNEYGSGWHDQFENDIWYVENISFVTDCKMVFGLIRITFDKKTRKQHAVQGPGDFLGYDTDGTAFGANNVPLKYMELLNQRD